MTKRVLLGHENPDSATGEIQWEPEHPESPDDTTKVWIGKVD